MDKEIHFCPPKNRKHYHTKVKGSNGGERDVNNNVISVFVNVKRYIVYFYSYIVTKQRS